jgi:hypothetical protein
MMLRRRAGRPDRPIHLGRPTHPPRFPGPTPYVSGSLAALRSLFPAQGTP